MKSLRGTENLLAAASLIDLACTSHRRGEKDTVNMFLTCAKIVGGIPNSRVSGGMGRLLFFWEDYELAAPFLWKALNTDNTDEEIGKFWEEELSICLDKLTNQSKNK